MIKLSHVVMFLFLGICYSCSNKNEDIFNEKNYTILVYDSGLTKMYRNKYDITRQLYLNFWLNGRLLSKQFLRNDTILDGKSFFYNNNRYSSFFGISNYHDGVKEDTQWIFDEKGKLKYFEVYKNGQLKE